MWLINARSMALEEVVSPEEHRYAILSHRWLRDPKDEVTFRDLADLRKARRKPGFAKIHMTCRKALEKGVDYAWVDTCCVDRESSAALSEAINSMFRWYKLSSFCFVHLHDLEREASSPRSKKAGDSDPVQEITESLWFTRGWTLQELIAPEVVEFYDRGWCFRGDKSLLRQKIAARTGIDIAVLEDSEALSTVPVGRRMSWASERETTRVEDLAYCLLGIFGVNMPVIYGEGASAFVRLQEEIVKTSNDLSLFAWTAQIGSKDDHRALVSWKQEFRGLFARSPAEFRSCRTIKTAEDQIAPMREFVIANNGCVRFEARLAWAHSDDGVFALDCSDGSTSKDHRERRLGIYLMRTKQGFVRSQASKTFSTYDKTIWAGPPQTLYIRKDVTPKESDQLKVQMPGSMIFHFHLPKSAKAHKFSARPSNQWDANGKHFITCDDKSFTGCVQFHLRPRYWRFVIVCGLLDPSANNPEVVGPQIYGHGGTIPWAAIFTDQDPAAASQTAIIEKVRKNGDEDSLMRLRKQVLEWHLDEHGRLPQKEMLDKKKFASDDDGEISYWLAVRPDVKDGVPVFNVNIFVQEINRLAGEADDEDDDDDTEDEFDVAAQAYIPRQAPDPPSAAEDYAPDSPNYTYPSPESVYSNARQPPLAGGYRPQEPQYRPAFGGPYPRPPPFVSGYRGPGPAPGMGYPPPEPPAFVPGFVPPPAPVPYGNPFAGGNGYAYGNGGAW